MPKVYTVTLTLPDGKRKYYRGKTKREAEEKREADRCLVDAGINLSDRSTFKDVAERWYKLYIRRKNLHIRSEETIRGILDRQVLPNLGRIEIRNLKPFDIDNMIANTSHLSQSTQKKAIGITKQIVNFAHENDLILRSPIRADHVVTARPSEKVEALTDTQCAELLNATKGTRVYPFIAVCLYAGLRRGEALGLMWSDIDFDASELSVKRSIVHSKDNRAGEINTDMKTKSAERKIPMCSELRNILLEAKQKSTSLYVFSTEKGTFLSEASFRRMWDLVKSHGIKFSVHPHQLRHTCVTRWIEQGIDVTSVQRLAGHATADITMDVYNHFREEARYETLREQLSAN